MKSILTVECIELTNEDTEEAGYNSVEVDGWLYQFTPLPGSIFQLELEGDSITWAISLLFDSLDDLHAEMQKIIADGKFHFLQYDRHYGIHLVTSESAWQEEDNWTGSGEWKVEIAYCGLLDFGRL